MMGIIIHKGMAKDKASGFQELPHTADVALHIWAPDLESLFEQAAQGMYALMQVRLQSAPRVARRLELSAQDAESLLVAFLSELIYLCEQERLVFDDVSVSIQDGRLAAELSGARWEDIAKAIKAVTFHQLAIRRGEDGLETTVVFDV